MSIPIIFLHRTDDSYLSFVLRQAKLTNPHSEVVLIGSPPNSKYAVNGIKHALIDDYFTGAAEFASVYKHLSPCEYYYNLFCFQRWFVLRDYMRSHHLRECWAIDSDVMLYADMKQRDFTYFASENTITSYTAISEIEDLCKLTLEHFSDPQLYEQLKEYTRLSGHVTSGQLAVSDMVTQRLYFETMLNRSRCHGFFGSSLFDTNLTFSFPGVEMLDNKKKIYLIDGGLFFKKRDSGEYLRVNSLHFTTGANKKYIPYFYMPNYSPILKGSYYFNYESCHWIPTSL
jgi:hypothetical protein